MAEIPLDDVLKPSLFHTLYGSPMSITSSFKDGSPMSWCTSIGSPRTRFGSPMAICESPMLVDVDKVHHQCDRILPQVTQLQLPEFPFPEWLEPLQSLPLLYDYLKQSWRPECRMFKQPRHWHEDFVQFASSIYKLQCQDQYGGIEHSMFQHLMSDVPFSRCLTVYGKLPYMIDIILVQSTQSWIYPISSYAAKYKPVITTSNSLRKALTSDNPYEEFNGLISPWSKAILDLIQLEIEAADKSCGGNICLLQKLVQAYRQLPPLYYICDVKKVGLNPVSGGGFSDIWKGIHNNTTVCLKVLRVFTMKLDQNKIFKECCQEAVIWKQLKHPNILPFIGVNTELFSPSFCLISPWMYNGNVIDYLQQLKGVEYLNLALDAIHGIALGMQYLHNFDPPIVHGDIRGANVLVDDEGVCHLADFGLAQIAETTGFKDSYSIKGSARWLAPEIWDPSMYPDFPTPSASWTRDVYAFGCTAYEIATLKHPFFDLKTDPSVICAVLAGKRPPRLFSNDLLKEDRMWDIIDQCWSHNPMSRPYAAFIATHIRKITLY